MGFTHLDENGAAVMVDVSGKAVTGRKATACGRITMSRECYGAVQGKRVKKGDVLAVARVAGIMAAKRTSDLIPLCHNINITACEVDFVFHEAECEIEAVCNVGCEGQTGVEMEALTGVSVSLLTLYDMCKAIDKRMVIGQIHLAEKTGGKSGPFVFEA